MAHEIAGEAWVALGGAPEVLRGLTFRGAGALPSAYAVSDLAAGTIGAAALAVAELGVASDAAPVDRRLASFWFAGSLRPRGWKAPAGWDPLAGDYLASDGWIRLHTNAARHRAAVLNVLGPCEAKTVLAQRVAAWSKADLETAIVAAGGCAAEMLSAAEWAAHPQGMAVRREPLVDVRPGDLGRIDGWRPTAQRPLAGIRVLDLTRVLAGPVATRFLAGYGAEVLRIDPPDWEEPAIAPEVTLGKRCARLDLQDHGDRRTFAALLARADVLVHGYRADALDQLGFGDAERREISPGLIDVALDAYGWTGPWRGRRGFDSLVQMSAGIAAAGAAWTGSEAPVPLPVQALDHATGYLMAAAAVRGLTARLVRGEGFSARVSLARTAVLLGAHPGGDQPAFAAETPQDCGFEVERTGWGEARRLRPPVEVQGAPMRWTWPAGPLGSARAEWQG